jgi:hypothetical protein
MATPSRRFGGIGFMEETEALLAEPGARPFEMRALGPWAVQSVAFARALPLKETK